MEPCPRTAARVAAIATLTCWLLVGLACTNSGLGLEDTTRPPVDTDETEPVATCPYVGTWALTEAKCGSFVIVDWFSTYAEARMVVTDPGDATCAVAFSWSGTGCAEEESWSFDGGTPVACAAPVPEGDPTLCYEVAAQGITSCTPDACAFPLEEDAACAVGDRAETLPIAVDPQLEGVLVVEGLLPHAWPACSLEINTSWARQ